MRKSTPAKKARADADFPSEQTESVDVSPLARAKENEFLFLSLVEVGVIFGFGRDVMTAICAVPGAPVVGKKCNPWLLREWLRENHHKVGKVRPE